MIRADLHLAREIPSFDSLGVGDWRCWLDEPGGEARGRGATVLERDAESVLMRFGGETNAPGVAGDGLRMRAYTGTRPRAALRARFTHPRSSCMAAREWNLLGHLRAQGVAVPEPLALGSARAAIFARRSFVVVRELEDAVALDEWLAGACSRDDRRRALAALGVFFGRLCASRVHLPDLALGDLRLLRVSACGLGTRASVASATGLALRPALECGLEDVRGGRILKASAARCLERQWLACLRRGPGRARFSELDLLRVFRHATRSAVSRLEGRALLATLRAQTGAWLAEPPAGDGTRSTESGR
jgi:hypothetical protein